MNDLAPALLVLPFRDREAFRRNLELRGQRPSLFVDGEIELAVGATMIVEVQFLDDGVHLSTGAVLAYRRRGSHVGSALRPGVGVELIPGPDTDLLLDYARGKRLLARGARRFEVKMKARCKHEEGATWVTGPPGDLQSKLDYGSAGSDGVVLEGVYTLPAARGKGLATHLVASCCHQLSGRAPMVCLHVDESNGSARRAYEKAGLEPVGECRILLVR